MPASPSDSGTVKKGKKTLPAGFKTQAGKGRPKGVPNKATAQIKDMITQALDKAGGVDYLHQQAIDNPGPFMTLVGKVLPMQITGADGGPIQHTVAAKDASDDALAAIALGK